MARALLAKRDPAGVSRIFFGSVTTSCAPSSRSIWRRCLLRVDCVVNSSCAAWVMLRLLEKCTNSCKYSMRMATPL